jgi:hypothetical protein
VRDKRNSNDRDLLAPDRFADQPRVPRGSPDGGQWTAGDGAVGSAGSRRDGGTAPQGEQVAVVTTNFDYACRALGLDRNVASEILHELKAAAKLSGSDQCSFDTETGEVFYRGEHIGNLNDQ